MGLSPATTRGCPDLRRFMPRAIRCGDPRAFACPTRPGERGLSCETADLHRAAQGAVHQMTNDAVASP